MRTMMNVVAAVLVTALFIALATALGSPAVAQAMRFELFPEGEVRGNVSNRVTSAYVIDKKENQFWICTVRYNYQDLTANNGQCVKLDAEIGRPSLNESYAMHPVTGAPMINPLLPVVWFIDSAKGDVRFCDIRHAGLCVRMNLP